MVFELKGHYSLVSKIKRLKKVIIIIGGRFLTAKVTQVRKNQLCSLNIIEVY